MTLVELLEVVDDHSIVSVWVHDESGLADAQVSVYNGKDSIDERWNNEEVENVQAFDKGTFDVMLNLSLPIDEWL